MKNISFNSQPQNFLEKSIVKPLKQLRRNILKKPGQSQLNQLLGIICFGGFIKQLKLIFGITKNRNVL